MNVFDLAMEKELEVKSWYEKLAKDSLFPGTKNIFTLLAADEQRHHDAVRNLKVDPDCSVPLESRALDTAKQVLGGYFGDTVPASKMKNSLDAYRHALSLEEASIRFYEDLLEEDWSEREKLVLSVILDQERQHYSVVENLYEYVLRPKYFLAWAEFSNLREL